MNPFQPSADTRSPSTSPVTPPNTYPFIARLAAANLDGSFVLFLALHVVLGVAIWAFPQLALIHIGVTLVAGFLWAASAKDVRRFAYLAAYITGAEVLWRMTSTSFFWELGKYSVIAVLGFGFLTMRSQKIPRLPCLYFLFLLPAIALTLSDVSLSDARADVSFNLAGHLALVIGAAFFLNLKLSKVEFQKLFVALSGPVLSIATFLLISIFLNSQQIRWINDSNFQTSGGFGPDQVSSSLALGALTLWFVFSLGSLKLVTRIILVISILWLLGQSMLTFARGGLYDTTIAIVGTITYLVITRKQKISSVLYVIAGVSLFLIIFFPQLNDFTHGALARRFSDTDTSGRLEIADVSVQLFLENPMGVGVGMATVYGVDLLGAPTAAHTEFARMFSEHGILGGLALALLGVMLFINVRKARNSAIFSTIVLASILWGLAYMTNAAMRIVAPSFMIAVSFVQFADSPSEVGDDKTS